jgi:Cyclic nucleotide-binding domain
MSADLMMRSERGGPGNHPSEDVAVQSKLQPRLTKWLLVGAQVFVLMAYAMGIAFLVKTTAGTLVLFSLVAPLLIAVAVLTLIGVAVHEFRKRHGISAFESYDTGQIIFRQGELGDCAYFIQSGEVEMIRQENGNENVVATLSEGDYFGEKALISSAPRTATIRAATQTRVGVIRKRSFLTMIIVMPAMQEDVATYKRTGRRGRKYGS